MNGRQGPGQERDRQLIRNAKAMAGKQAEVNFTIQPCNFRACSSRIEELFWKRKEKESILMKKHSGIWDCLTSFLSLMRPTAGHPSKFIRVCTGVEVYVDGVRTTPTDGEGNPLGSFVYHGIPYVPLQTVSQSLGKTTDWDGVNERAYIGSALGPEQYLEDVCPPYQTFRYKECGRSVMAGQVYSHTVKLGSSDPDRAFGWALYHLDGQYDFLTFTMGFSDGGPVNDGTLSIFLDGELTFEVEMNVSAMPQTFTVPLHHALQMKLHMMNDAYRLAEMKVQ